MSNQSSRYNLVIENGLSAASMLEACGRSDARVIPVMKAGAAAFARSLLIRRKEPVTLVLSAAGMSDAERRRFREETERQLRIGEAPSGLVLVLDGGVLEGSFAQSSD